MNYTPGDPPELLHKPRIRDIGSAALYTATRLGVADHDFGRFGTLVDVGGGHGALRGGRMRFLSVGTGGG